MFKKKPFFIVFEGIEGCGKSFQSKKLYNNLKKKKFKTILTREPGGTKNAELIRKLILNDYFGKKEKKKFDRYTDTLLYLAARNEHVKNKIYPELKKGKVVICDRFTDSTMAYQVYGKKVKKNFINSIHKYILGNIRPDITFLLKVNLNISRKRVNKRKSKNRYDKFPKEFYRKAQNAFKNIAKNKKRYVILDSTKENDELEKKILNIVIKRVNK
tara:strand:+ start:203 stop:847 length:645 start_codon:yes stop_codon:yes gene_type:complete